MCWSFYTLFKINLLRHQCINITLFWSKLVPGVRSQRAPFVIKKKKQFNKVTRAPPRQRAPPLSEQRTWCAVPLAPLLATSLCTSLGTNKVKVAQNRIFRWSCILYLLFVKVLFSIYEIKIITKITCAIHIAVSCKTYCNGHKMLLQLKKVNIFLYFSACIGKFLCYFVYIYIYNKQQAIEKALNNIN